MRGDTHPRVHYREYITLMDEFKPVQVCDIFVNAFKGLVEPGEDFQMVLTKLLIAILQLLHGEQECESSPWWYQRPPQATTSILMYSLNVQEPLFSPSLSLSLSLL